MPYVQQVIFWNNTRIVLQPLLRTTQDKQTKRSEDSPMMPMLRKCPFLQFKHRLVLILHISGIFMFLVNQLMPYILNLFFFILQVW